MGRPLKYEGVNGTIIAMPAAALLRFYNLSGKFVGVNASSNIEMADATAVDIQGWAKSGERICSATAGADKIDVDTNLNKLREMPAILNDGTAPTEAQLILCVGQTCDIKMVSTYYQYANVNTGAVDILLIVGYRYYGSAVGMQSVIVKINPVKLVYLDVAGA